MSQLIRLVYASRSTFTRGAQHQGLDPGVARILAKSRKNNAGRQIVGGLLFGDGCFLQCLEGEVQAIETLYKKIESDTRHRDVTVLSRREISQRSFGAWSMKYVPGEQALADALKSWGATRFDPYRLSADQIEAAVELMREQADAVNTLPGEFDDDPAHEPVQDKSARVVSRLKPSPSLGPAQAGVPKNGSGRRLWFGVLAVAALVVGAAAYWRFG